MGQISETVLSAINIFKNGDMPSSYISDCVIQKSSNRAINIYGSNYIKVHRNVIYDITGSAFVLQEGTEIGNEFSNNLAILIRTTPYLMNEDVTPAGFLINNPNNSFIENTVVSSTHYGFWYNLETESTIQTNFCPRKVKLGKFEKNKAHSVGKVGLFIFPEYTPSPDGQCWDNRYQEAEFNTFMAFNNDKGVEFFGSSGVILKNFLVFDHHSTGIEFKNIAFSDSINFMQNKRAPELISKALISNSIIIGRTKFDSESTNLNYGLVVPWSRGLEVENVKFYNFPDSFTRCIRATTNENSCT